MGYFLFLAALFVNLKTNQKMKKLLFVAIIGTLVACGESTTTAPAADTTAVVDSAAVVVDSAAAVVDSAAVVVDSAAAAK